MSNNSGVPREFFDSAYDAAPPPWEIGRPQEDILRLHARGGFRGKILDIGCGTGEHALFLAAQGFEVTGLDCVPAAIDKATAKAKERGVKVTFEVADVLQLQRYKQAFDTVLDTGLFHVFSDADRVKYVRSLASVTREQGTLHILCFSDQEPGTEGPRRVTERELVETFNLKGWLVEEIAEARFESNRHPDGAHAWLATFSRFVS